MRFFATHLPDVVLVEPTVLRDDRGFFMETWESRKFAAGGIQAQFVQDNHSSSKQWVLRGLHYQCRHAQGKLVRVVQGEIFDVAVDLRTSSSTFGRWVGEVLSDTNRRMMWVPVGFAHGFLVLSDRAEVAYKCTDFYDSQAERALLWDDPGIGIAWPLPKGIEPIVSAKDGAAPKLDAAERFP